MIDESNSSEHLRKNQAVSFQHREVISCYEYTTADQENTELTQQRENIEPRAPMGRVSVDKKSRSDELQFKPPTFISLVGACLSFHTSFLLRLVLVYWCSRSPCARFGHRFNDLSM